MTKVIKQLIGITSIALFLIALLFFTGLISFKPWSSSQLKSTHNLLLEKVCNLGELELAKYHFKDIVEQELVRDYLPDPKALLIVHGEAIGCINLTDLSPEDIQVDEAKITITLPSATICSWKINHQKSKIYNTTNAFMSEATLINEAYKSAEEKIYQSALSSDILKLTKANAVRLLKPILSTVSEKEVIFK